MRKMICIKKIEYNPNTFGVMINRALVILFLPFLLVSCHLLEELPTHDSCLDKNSTLGVVSETTISSSLQAYGEELLKNKVGAIVAIDPRTGALLATVSSPDSDSGLPEKYHPGGDRCFRAGYPAGSVFSIVNGIIGLNDGVLREETEVTCTKGYVLDNGIRMPCHGHQAEVNLEESVMMNCNTYSYQAFSSIIENPSYESLDAALDHWKDVVGSLGFGHRIGLSLEGENPGFIPGSLKFQRTFGSTLITSKTALRLAVGEDDILVTPLQLANFAAIIANRGYYYTPFLSTDAQPERIECGIASENFSSIIRGMWRSANSAPGTGGAAWVTHLDGLDVCAKCGSAANYNGPDNSVFIGFAPKDNPKIAIAVYIENGGYGASFAGPIGSLMIEKYSRGYSNRLDLETHMKDANLLNRGRYTE